MRAPIEVRITDGTEHKVVTKFTSGLRYRLTAPGGHESASCQIKLPASAFTDLGPSDKMFVQDSRSGATLWEGYTNNPGTQSGNQGDGLDLSAMGGVILASDRAERLIYIDNALDRWRRDDYAAMAASANTDNSTLPDTGTPALLLQFNPGQPVTTGSTAKMVYDLLDGTTMVLGGFSMVNRSGIADANYEARWFIDPGGVMPDSRAFATGGSTRTKFAITDWTVGPTRLTIRIQRVAGGATNVATDTVWSAFAAVKVLGQRINRNGTNVTLSSAASVLASEVVEDMLGRILTACDPNSSVVETTTFAIDQLAYLDATNAASVLDGLTLYEPDFLWEILESNSAGKHRFNYRAWPTTPRYIIGSREQVEMPGSDVDLCNRIAVNWTDAQGKQQSRAWGTLVPALGNLSPVNNVDGTLDPAFVGRIRDADPISLPEGRGSLANAQRIALQILAAKANPPSAARATITRPIVDTLTGGVAQPWEIQPGYLARVQETGEDMRITEMEYTDDDCAASLTLGDPVLTADQRLARLTQEAAKGGKFIYAPSGPR